MLKYLGLIFLLSMVLPGYSAEQKMTNTLEKIVLPFSNEKGVPYLDSSEIDGKIVGCLTNDSDNNIFIMGGDPAILVKYSPEGKEIFRRKYSEFQAGYVYAENLKLYIFDGDNGKNMLYILDAETGKIVEWGQVFS